MSGDDHKLRKHSIIIAGHQTSITLENVFWHQFKQIAARRNVSPGKLIAQIDLNRDTNLSSAIRVFVLQELLEG